MDIRRTAHPRPYQPPFPVDKAVWTMDRRHLSTDLGRLFTSLSFKLKEKQNNKTLSPRMARAGVIHCAASWGFLDLIRFRRT
jgi:hypothetical protein